MYISETPIDNYIDKFWFINCPNNMSVAELRNQVRRLLHEVMTQNDEYNECEYA